MTKEDFLQEIRIYDHKIIEAIQDYYLMERMVDWQNYVGQNFKIYSSAFIPISRALHANFVGLYTSLFDDRSKYSISKLIDINKNEDWYLIELDNIVVSIDNLINNNKTKNEVNCIIIPDNQKTKTTDLAQKWRDKVLFHFDKEAIKEDSFNKLQENYPLHVPEMLINLKCLHNYINDIRNLLGSPKSKIITEEQSLDYVMMKIFNINTCPKFGFDISFLKNDYKI